MGMELVRQVFQKGETIFAEGERGTKAYVVNEGEAEVSVKRQNRMIRLARLGPGECFGEMAVLGDGIRTATVTAATRMEVYVFEASELHSMLQQSLPVPRAIVLALVRRLQTQNDAALQPGGKTNPTVAAAHVLALLGRALGAEQAFVKRCNRSSNAPRNDGSDELPLEVSIPMTVAMREVASVLCLPPHRVRTLMQNMADLNLFRREGRGLKEQIVVKPSDVVTQSENLQRILGETLVRSLHDHLEWIDFGELADLLDLSIDELYVRLMSGGLRQDMVLFNKHQALTHLQGRQRN